MYSCIANWLHIVSKRKKKKSNTKIYNITCTLYCRKKVLTVLDIRVLWCYLSSGNGLRQNAFNIPGQNYWWAIKKIATKGGIMSEDSGRFLLLQKYIFQFSILNYYMALWQNVNSQTILINSNNLCLCPRTATRMDGTLPNCNFENLKQVEISKNHSNIIWNLFKKVI